MVALIAEGRDQLEGDRLVEAVATYNEAERLLRRLYERLLHGRGVAKSLLHMHEPAVADFEQCRAVEGGDCPGNPHLITKRASLASPPIQVVTANPDSAELRTEVGAFRVGRLKNLITWLSGLSSPSLQAASANPDSAELWMEVGVEREALGQHERAHEAFSCALLLQPRNAEALKRRGLSAFNLYRFKESLKDLLPALHMLPNDADLNQAVHCFSQPPSLLPPRYSHAPFPPSPPPIPHFFLLPTPPLFPLFPRFSPFPPQGIALVRSNQFRAAQPYLARAVELLPGDADLRKEKGRLHRLLGETHQAERDLLLSLQLGQDASQPGAAEATAGRPLVSIHHPPPTTHHPPPTTHHPTTPPPLHLSTPSPLHPSAPPPLHLSTPSPLHPSAPPPLHLSTPSPLHPSAPPPLRLYTLPPLRPSTPPSRVSDSIPPPTPSVAPVTGS
ncbi:unnamed protein product [Closterium sp. Naga37s-1]|nr:unnamed protein product [Closterium sp. Naga37s-1]